MGESAGPVAAAPLSAAMGRGCGAHLTGGGGAARPGAAAQQHQHLQHNDARGQGQDGRRLQHGARLRADHDDPAGTLCAGRGHRPGGHLLRGEDHQDEEN